MQIYSHTSKAINNARRLILQILILIFFSSISQAQLAIVVSQDSPIYDLQAEQLKLIFLGQIPEEIGLDKIQPCDFAPAENDFCERLFDMSAKRYNQHWFKLIFSGAPIAPPKQFSSVEELISYINNNPHAIGYLTYDQAIESGLRIVRISGKLPDAPDYLLAIYPLQNPMEARNLLQH